MAELRYALVGGKPTSIGGEHLDAILDRPGVRLAALCDTDPEQRAAAAEVVPHAVAAYEDHEALFDGEDIDAAVIATPNHTHEAIAMQAFEAGADVLCEKPLAPTLEGCDAIIAAAEDAGCLLQVGLHRRYNRLYRRIERLIEEGAIGEPAMLWSRELRGDWAADGIVEDDERGRVNWRLHGDLSGGTLVEKSCHDFDVFNWFAGAPPERVVATGGLAGYDDRDTADHAAVIVEYANGVEAVLQLGLFVPHGFHGRDAGLVGDRGTLEIDEGTDELVQHFRDRGDEVTFSLDDPERGHGHGVHGEHTTFADCVRERTRPFADGAVGRASIAVARAAQASMRTGDPVAVPGPGETLD